MNSKAVRNCPKIKCADCVGFLSQRKEGKIGRTHRYVRLFPDAAMRQKDMQDVQFIFGQLLILLCLLISLTACGTNKGRIERETFTESSGMESVKLGNADIPPVTDNLNEDAAISGLSEKEEYIAQLMNGMTLEEKVGQMFICSFETNESGGPLTEIDKATVDAIKKYKIGGVIYFAANIDDAEQTKKLSHDLQSAGGIPLFIAVDEEGGRVSRITRSQKIDFQKTPSAKEIGNTGDSKNAYSAAVSIAGILTELGINANFAPCADLDSDNRGVIGDRAFSGDPAIAGEFVQKAVSGYGSSGIICGIKHFPGHGVAPGDTHDESIVSEKNLSEILNSDILPFVAGAASGAPMVMFSHITVPEWNAPASLSADAVNYLRDEIGYDGIIITDSFCMGAITNYYTPEEAAVGAVNAGINIILMPENIEQAAEGVISAVLDGETDVNKIDISVEKILSLKYDYGLLNGVY